MATSDPDKKNTQLIDPEDTKKPETTVAINAVEKMINDRWLAERSDDELIEVIARASAELHNRRTSSTQKIAKEDVPAKFRDVMEIPLEKYRTLPATTDKDTPSDDRTWHIILISAESSHAPIPLKIVGDVIMGRGAEGVSPDLDLTAHDAEQNGISRMHALLRPLPDQLIINDLGSTNGTQYNGERLSLGKPKSVTDKGVISLGKLHFQVRVIRQPGESKETEPEKKS